MAVVAHASRLRLPTAERRWNLRRLGVLKKKQIKICNMEQFDAEQLKFPLTWHGRLVMVAGAENVEDSVRRIYAAVGVTEGEVSYAHNSSKGTYETWKLDGTVHDLSMLHELFKALELLPGVKMLL